MFYSEYYNSFIYRTAIGLRVKDGVVLAVEKLVQSKLLVAGANRRIQSADLHVGIVRETPYPCNPIINSLH
jgi:20S proteasome subunit alpha 7